MIYIGYVFNDKDIADGNIKLHLNERGQLISVTNKGEVEVTMKYDGDKIIYYEDNEGNWWDAKVVSYGLPYYSRHVKMWAHVTDCGKTYRLFISIEHQRHIFETLRGGDYTLYLIVDGHIITKKLNHFLVASRWSICHEIKNSLEPVYSPVRYKSDEVIKLEEKYSKWVENEIRRTRPK